MVTNPISSKKFYDNGIKIKRFAIIAAYGKKSFAIFFAKFIIDFLCDFGHLAVFEREFACKEIHVALLVDRNQVNVCVWHFKTHHSHANAFAGHHSLHGCGNFVGKIPESGIFLGAEVEDVVNLVAWNHKSVAFGNRVDVEESIEILVLGNLVAGNLTGSYF